MTHLEQAQQIISQIAGITVTSTVKNAISALNDLLVLQKTDVQSAGKAVTAAKEKLDALLIEQKKAAQTVEREISAAKEREDDEKLTYKMIENMQKKATMQRQELRDEKYSHGL